MTSKQCMEDSVYKYRRRYLVRVIHRELTLLQLKCLIDQLLINSQSSFTPLFINFHFSHYFSQ